MIYAIYRLKDTEENANRLFMSSKYLRLTHYWPPKSDDYEKIYEGTLPDLHPSANILEWLYAKFNVGRPADFHHYSMSVGDIVTLTADKTTAHFCDKIGFTEIPEFVVTI